MKRAWIRSTIACPTIPGTVVIALSVICGWAGLKTGNNLLLFDGCLLAGIWMVCGVRSSLNLRGLQVRRTLSRPLFAGSTTFTSIRMEHTGRFPAACLLRVTDSVDGRGLSSRMPVSLLARVSRKGHTRVRQLVKFSRRGVVTFRAVRVESTFPLGLFRAARFFELPEKAVVYPRLRPVPSALTSVERIRCRGEALLIAASRGDEEFAGLREFRPGDNPRWIHWKSSARGKGRLLVKELEGIMPRRVKIVFENRTPAKDARGRIRFERAVSLGASIANALVARRFIVDFHLPGVEAVFVAAPHGEGLYQLFHALAMLEPSSISNQEEAACSEPGLDTLPCMVIRPDRLVPDQPLERVLAWE